ncbi:MAG: hypothetical protein QOH61_730 [Chloroflexota bacterium]|nr:hypothetical protein [Chloroflexota bacterium]
MTLDHAGFQDWLDRYVAAWKSYDPEQIGDLFSEDAEYRYHPQSDPVRGRAAIVSSWLDNKDDPGTYDAGYEPLAIDGENHVAQGWSRYLDADGALRDEYWNIYLVRFDADGRASLFTEWWMQNREFARAAREEIAAKAVADTQATASPGT